MHKGNIKKFIAVWIALVLILPGGVTGFAAEAGEGEVVIYHTNDVHGAAAWVEDGSIGLDRVAAMKKQTENAILVDAGDATQGLPYASLTQGADVIETMNAAGYDVMAAGNHEFDYGTERLLDNVQRAEFPVLAANVYKDGVPLLSGGDSNGCHTMIERGGKKIGFFGLTTASTATSTNPAGIAGVEFGNEIEAAKREIDELTAEGADAIIAIAHLGEYTNVSCDSAKLAESMTGDYSGKLDVIIDGHSHTEENKEVNNILIMQTGTGLANLGKITLDFGDDNVLDAVSGELLTYEEVMSQAEPDPDVAAKIEAVSSGMADLLSEPLADSETTLWGGTVDGVAEPRVVETNLGSFAADAFRDAAERFLAQAAGMEEYRDLPVIGVENGGGIRASLPNGTISKGDLVSVFPFSNTLMMKRVTPSILYEVLESSVSSITGQDPETGLLTGEPNGGFLQVSGIRFAYDPSAPAGEKVQEVKLEESGAALERTDTETGLMLVSNNFIMNGGSGHDVLAGLALVGEIGGELETVEAYLIEQAAGSPLAARGDQGRIVAAGGYTPKEYTASILVEKEDGSLAADVPVAYYLDGGEAVEGQTDSEGLLRITVPDGPHGVKLAPGQREVYVNNYTGAGTVETEYRGFPVLTYEAAAAQPAAAESEAPAVENPFPWIWIAIAAAVVCAAVWMMLRARKRQSE